MNLLLWDGSFCPISLFSLNKYLDGNAKNITCFLLRIATLIKQHKLKDKTTENISQIREFSFVAWKLLSAIYKASWDKLATNKDNKLSSRSLKTMNQNSLKKEKKTNVSRILLSILSRLS